MERAVVREVIFQSDHLHVVHAETGSATVVVTFNDLAPVAGDGAFWGADLLAGVGVSAIGFVSARPNWFPPLAMIPALEAAVARIAGRRVVTYGASQGGYGALKFGAALSADLTLAFSPQWSINPEDVEAFDARFTHWYDSALRNGEPVEPDELGRRAIIGFDPACAPDRGHADRLLALGRVSPVLMPFSGTDTHRLVDEGGIGAQLIGLCLAAPGPDPAAVRRLIRGARAASPGYAAAKLVQLRASPHRHGRFLRAATAALADGPAKAMATTLNQLAAGDLVAAEATLSTITDAELVALDFPSVWEPFRAAGFLSGEARLAPLFRTYYSDNLWLRLRGVDSMITTGAEDAALQELQELTVMDSAFAHAGFFLDDYNRLGRLDLASAFAQSFADNESVSKTDRIRVGFAIVSALRAHDMRGPLFRELQRLKELCVGDLRLTVQLAELYIAIGEKSVARDILTALPSPAEDAPIVKFYLLQLDPFPDRPAILAGLHRLFAEETADTDFWIKLSYAADDFADPALALEATRRAVALAPEPTVWLRIRLAQVLTGTGQHPAAIAELEALVADDQAMRFSGQTLGDLAAACNRPALAVRIAERWLALCPEDTQARLMRCLYQRKAGDDAGLRTAARDLLQAVQGGATLTVVQFRQWADCVRGTAGALETALAKEAAAQHPYEEEFRVQAKPDSFAAKFLAPAPAPAPVRAKKPGLFARLRPKRDR